MNSIEHSPADVLIGVYRQVTPFFVSYKLWSCEKPKVDLMSKDSRLSGE